MYELPKDQMNNSERAILRKLRVWIVALAVSCLVAGIGIGAMLNGRQAIARDEVAGAAKAPEALSASFSEIASRVEPAVVNIDTVTAAPEVVEREGEDKDDPAINNPLLDMLRRQARRPARGVGSGFIVDPKGYILTNQHVVQGATRIIVRLQSGEEFRGTIKGIDEETDLAVIKIDAPRDLPTVQLGNSNDVQVGDWVLAIGSPFGLDQTVTAGIISKKERQAAAFTSFQQFLQTDAAINKGNSGGPLVNMRGEVIGINSQIATSTGDYNGIGFALPSNEASFVYQQIVSGGRVRRGYLGIFLDSVRSEFARVYGMEDNKGAIVTDVRDQQGPAGKAGILANDVIVEYNGQPVTSAQDLINKVAGTTVGETVAMTYLRDVNGKLERRTTSVVIGERPGSLAPKDDEEPLAQPKKGTTVPQTNRLRLGITLQELTPQTATERKLTGVHGLYVKDIDPNGIIADARPRSVVEGDVILRINRTPVTTLEEFERVVSSLKPGDAVVLNVARYDPDARRIVQRVVQFTYQ